ncbi:MAG: succinylglutamate desuccinylase/aspartoacylase family protein [Thermoproteota archaeon]
MEKRLIEVGRRPDGSPVSVPFIRLGSGERKLFIAVAVHGNEVTGLASIWRFIGYLQSAGVHGEVGIVPVVNVEGFNYNVRGIPLATVDLNRVYPGDPSGSLAERIAHTVWSLASQYEFIVDMHTAGLSIPFILVDPAPEEVRRRVLEAAAASGITVLEEYAPEKYERRRLAASLPGVAVREGIPSFTVELPSLYRPDEPGIAVGFKVLKNVAVHLGIVEDGREEVTEYPVLRELGYRREDVTASKHGFIEYRVSLGQRAAAGQEIAAVRSVLGDVVEVVKMPKEGYIVALNSSFRAWTGSNVALIAVKS